MKPRCGPENFVAVAQAAGDSSVVAGDQIPLSAGDVRMIYLDGDLRYLSVGSHEIVRRITAPIRDDSWGTVPVKINDASIHKHQAGFDIRFTAENRRSEFDFPWRAIISGRSSELADGRSQTQIIYSIHGKARSPFRTCRAGLCILHPVLECRGKPCTIETAGGRIYEDRFPDLIAPHQPFTNIRSLRWTLADARQVAIEFEGDTFETEDQRNWTDTSFKTYCRPLALPFPYLIEQGEEIRQSVKITITGGASAVTHSRPALSVIEQPAAQVGGIGLGLGDFASSITSLQASRLRSLSLSHVRLDVEPSTAGWEESLACGIAAAMRMEVPIELGLHLSATDLENRSELQRAIVILRQMKVGINRCIVYEVGRDMPSPHILDMARTRLENIPEITSIGSGTAGNFAELNRNRPPAGTAALLAWPVNPQRHAGDSLTLIENLAAQGDTVLTARSFAPFARFSVGPVTFHRIADPATVGRNGNESQHLCLDSDPRQQELLGAVWTLGSLKYLLESGVDFATYFEAAGPLGVLEHDHVFPLYHVLADIMEFSAGEVLTCTDPERLRFIGLFLRHGTRRRFIVANLLAEPQSVAVVGLNGMPCVGGFRLDPATIKFAMHEPEEFRLRASRWTGTVPETVDLPPYSIARFDLAWKE